MKLLLISHEYPPIGGGGANACMNLAKEYALQGHQVHIVTVGYGNKIGREVLVFDSGNVTIDRLRAKRKKAESCTFAEMLDFLRLAIPFSRKLVQEEKSAQKPFDACQIFFGIPSGVVGWWLKKREGLPYIIRFGGGDIPGFQERFRGLYYVLSPVVRIIWKQADELVANSDGLKRMATRFYDRYPIRVIPNGVDCTQFHPAERKPSNSDEVTLLFVSRLIERKGLQYVIPKMNHMQKMSGKKLRLIIVGDGSYRRELDRVADESGIREQIIFSGQQEKDMLPAYYQKGDIFILPSKKEGMPNVVLEAMASGLPIVMSPCEGSKELIQGNGIIADADLQRFADAILTLLSLPMEQLRVMGVRSRKLAEEYFTWSVVAEKYEWLLARAAEKKKE